MSAQHTQGRLHLTSQDDLPTGSASFDPMAGVDTIVLYHDNAKADARRLVACWNACEGISTDELDTRNAASMHPFKSTLNTAGNLDQERAVLLTQRDELLAALEDALSVCRSVSISRDRRIVRDGCTLYAQTEEWCKWVEDEIGPKLIAAIAKVKGGAA